MCTSKFKTAGLKWNSLCKYHKPMYKYESRELRHFILQKNPENKGTSNNLVSIKVIIIRDGLEWGRVDDQTQHLVNLSGVQNT